MLLSLIHISSSGEILYHGENVTGKSVNAAKYRSHVGMVFQSFNLFNNMTVLKNCMVAVSYTHLDVYKRQPVTGRRLPPSCWMWRASCVCRSSPPRRRS